MHPLALWSQKWEGGRRRGRWEEARPTQCDIVRICCNFDGEYSRRRVGIPARPSRGGARDWGHTMGRRPRSSFAVRVARALFRSRRDLIKMGYHEILTISEGIDKGLHHVRILHSPSSKSEESTSSSRPNTPLSFLFLTHHHHSPTIYAPSSIPYQSRYEEA